MNQRQQIVTQRQTYHGVMHWRGRLSEAHRLVKVQRLKSDN
jgi:hypothetical protein